MTGTFFPLIRDDSLSVKDAPPCRPLSRNDGIFTQAGSRRAFRARKTPCCDPHLLPGAY